MTTLLLFIAMVLAEIVGCYLPYLWLKQGRSVWLLLPAALSLALFAWDWAGVAVALCGMGLIMFQPEV